MFSISDDDPKPSLSSESQNNSYIPGEEKEYECVICGHSSPSTEDKTIGLVVLMQATSGVLQYLFIFSLPIPQFLYKHRKREVFIC